MTKRPKKTERATHVKESSSPTRKPKQKLVVKSSFDVDFDPGAQLRTASTMPSAGRTAGQVAGGSPDVLDRLWDIIEARRDADQTVSHSARLLAKGTPHIVQKLGEEAVECLVEAMAENQPGLISESADLLYHLMVAWVNARIRPEQVWAELEKREHVSRMANGKNAPLKRLLGKVNLGTTKIP